MKEFFKSLISGAEPASSMRFVMVFCVLFIVLTTIGTWGFISMGKQEIKDIPLGLATFVVALVSIFIAGKVSQAVWGEKTDIKNIVNIVEDTKKDEPEK